MEDTAPRRGRPPLTVNTTAIDKPPVVAGRRRRASVGGHALKLAAPERPGFIRRWVNDEGNKVANAESLAYEFVADTSIPGTGEGSRVSRLVGTQANGNPLRAFLMETPVEEFQAGSAEKEAHNAEIDQAILRGVDSTGQLGPASETYGEGSIKRG